MVDLLRLAEITAQRKAQSRADFVHSRQAQMGHSLPEPTARHRDRVVQIYCALRFHAVLFI
jgi:hypothetical protein